MATDRGPLTRAAVRFAVETAILETADTVTKLKQSVHLFMPMKKMFVAFFITNGVCVLLDLIHLLIRWVVAGILSSL